MSDLYQRPELTEDDKSLLAAIAYKINQLTDTRKRLAYIGALVAENHRLTAECNEHRTVRGFERLPVYDPKKANIG